MSFQLFPLCWFDERLLYRVHKLLKVLKEENKERAHYFTYLHQSRLTLLKLNSLLNRAKQRLDRFVYILSSADTI